MTRSQRTCAFCGATSGFSDEHVWPRWIGKYTQPTDTKRASISMGMSHDRVGAMTVYPAARRERDGSVLGFRVREVCKRCNNDWMSKLESRVERLVVPLMHGQEITLEADQVQDLVTWAVKTAWMNEFLGRPGADPTPMPATTPAMRRYLMDHQAPPPHTRAWIGAHRGLYHLDIRAAELTITPTPDPDDPEVYVALLTALTVDKLTLLVWTAETPRVLPPQLPSSYWHLLWPTTGPLRWPMPRTVNDHAIDIALSRHADRHPLPPHGFVVPGDYDAGVRRRSAQKIRAAEG